MITYAERACFRASHMHLLSRVEACVARVSNTWGNELRCHELARAVHLVVYEAEVKLDVVDGHCGPIEHSWLGLASKGRLFLQHRRPFRALSAPERPGRALRTLIAAL
jgi:hypothetical protein